MRKVPENNSLKKEIRKLLELCKKDEKDNGEKRNYFNAPITEEEMINWEERNRAKIPESYKEWLRFSGKCRIAGNTATFWEPNEFHSEYVPEGLVAIGEINGDGEVVLKEVIKLMDDKPILSQERYLEILQKIKEKKDREKNK